MKHLLDYYREIGSWMAFAVLLEYVPERKNSPGYHIVTGDDVPAWGTRECRFTLHFIQTAALHLTRGIAGGQAPILADGTRNNK